MTGRHPRTSAAGPASRTQGALIHRGPGAMAASQPTPALYQHAPNAALLIDFDNVTMGIRSDLGKELRNLLSSDIIKGKVAVQRAYADWRRYPQYIVPLAESSIDMIMAPAYGSSKKNATDIRLAVDAMELVFTRPEIGTYILLSGDSDFASLVTKLKEYGKYVIGVGIRESSSDLLVMNCDEYYSYNALAGLVKASEEETARKFDPYELVSEAVLRMKRNGDVMRSDRLKQVMQEIDPSFDEKNLGMSKFSRFVQEAAHKSLLTVTKLENGQLEIGVPAGAETRAAESDARTERAPAESETRVHTGEHRVHTGEHRVAGERTRDAERGRGRRGRGRGRGRDRERSAPATVADATAQLETVASNGGAPAAPETSPAAAGGESIGISGERLTRNEAFDLVRRAVETLTTSDDDTTRASDVRSRAHEILGRDSESLNERMFVRILKDAHDAGMIDLRRRGDDFEVARAAEAPPVAEQVARADAAAAPPRPSAPSAPRLGMGHRGAGRGRGRADGPPPELLAIGVVDDFGHHAPPAVADAEVAPSESRELREAPDIAPSTDVEGEAESTPRARPGRRGTGRKRPTPAKSTQAIEIPPQLALVPSGDDEESASVAAAARSPRRGRAKTAVKSPARRPRARKTTPRTDEQG